MASQYHCLKTKEVFQIRMFLRDIWTIITVEIACCLLNLKRLSDMNTSTSHPDRFPNHDTDVNYAANSAEFMWKLKVNRFLFETKLMYLRWVRQTPVFLPDCVTQVKTNRLWVWVSQH